MDMRYGDCNPKAKAVINCRGEIYTTAKEAGIKNSACPSGISKVCRGKSKHCEKYSDGSLIKWEYLDEVGNGK